MNRRYINFGLSSDDYAIIARAAKDAGMTPGQYARYSALQSAYLGAVLSKLDEIITAVDNVPQAIVAYRDKLREVGR